MVTLKTLAERTRLDRSALRKHCVRRGYPMHKVYIAGTRGQATLALSEDDAARVLSHYQFRLDEC